MNRMQQILNEKRMSMNPEGPANALTGLHDLIRDFFKPGDRVAEIGSFEGSSTELFALMLSSGWVWSIDPYDTGTFTEQEGIENICAAERRFVERMKRYSNVTKLKYSSLDAVGFFGDHTLDAVYIDGDHRYDAVQADIRAYWPKVKVGGVIAGHDFYEDIAQAVRDVLVDDIKTYSDSSWAIVKTVGKELK